MRLDLMSNFGLQFYMDSLEQAILNNCASEFNVEKTGFSKLAQQSFISANLCSKVGKSRLGKSLMNQNLQVKKKSKQFSGSMTEQN